jgi:hypothetical protein
MKHIFFLFLILANIATLNAQNAPASSPDRGKESHEDIEKMDQGSNLERKQYKEISEKNRERITNGIKLLTIVSANFGDEVPESKAGLENIRKDYQVALRYYYRNAYILSGKSAQKVEKDLTDLLSKFTKLYDVKTQALLSECADTITETEQTQLIGDSQEAGKVQQGNFIDVSESAHKLKIAYYQLSLALEMIRVNRHYEALIHYRIAKDYGIKILMDLKGTEADRKTVSDKYAKDLADNRNLISGQAAQAK